MPKTKTVEIFLHEAVAWQNIDAGVQLIRLGINVNTQDKNGQTPLHFAGIHSSAVLARMILVNGGDCSIIDRQGNTPVWHAAFSARGKYETVQIFMDFGGRQVVGVKNAYGRSPLDFAQQIGDSTMMAILLGS